MVCNGASVEARARATAAAVCRTRQVTGPLSSFIGLFAGSHFQASDESSSQYLSDQCGGEKKSEENLRTSDRPRTAVNDPVFNAQANGRLRKRGSQRESLLLCAVRLAMARKALPYKSTHSKLHYETQTNKKAVVGKRTKLTNTQRLSGRAGKRTNERTKEPTRDT